MRAKIVVTHGPPISEDLVVDFSSVDKRSGHPFPLNWHPPGDRVNAPRLLRKDAIGKLSVWLRCSTVGQRRRLNNHSIVPLHR